MHYSQLCIENFRSISRLTLDGLKRVNLFAGRNGVGKSSILEAIFLNVGAPNPMNLLKPHQFRGTHIEVNLEQRLINPNLGLLFNFEDSTQQIVIKGTLVGNDQARTVRIQVEEAHQLPLDIGDEEGGSRIRRFETKHGVSWKLRFQVEQGSEVRESWLSPREDTPISEWLKNPIPFPNAVYNFSSQRHSMEESAARLSELKKTKTEAVLIDALKVIEPQLTGLSIYYSAKEPQILCDMEGLDELIPSSIVGEGFNRLMGMLLTFHEVRGGFVLIDELENGFHHSIHPKLIRSLSEFAHRNDVQIFATTHSKELAIAAAGELANEVFAYYRIERKRGSVGAIQFSGNEVLQSVEADLEVR